MPYFIGETWSCLRTDNYLANFPCLNFSKPDCPLSFLRPLLFFFVGVAQDLFTLMPFYLYSYCSSSSFCATKDLIGGVLIELNFLEAKFETSCFFGEGITGVVTLCRFYSSIFVSANDSVEILACALMSSLSPICHLSIFLEDIGTSNH